MNTGSPMNGMRMLVAATLCTILAPAATVQAQEPSARAYVDRSEVTAGETLRLVVEVSGVRTLERVALPWFTGARTVESVVAVRLGDLDGGVAGNTFTLSYDVLYEAAGSFELGSFEITADGRTMETEPIAVQVNPRDGGGVTVEASVAPARVRVGEDFSLSAEVFGSAFAELRFVAPDVFDFAEPAIATGSGTTRSWRLRAVVPGEFVIAPVRVTDPRGTFESEPLTVVIEPRELEVQGTLEAGSIWVGGEFMLEIEVTGATELDEEPVLPATGDFAELMALERSTSSISGRAARVYRFRALQAGRFEIGPVQVAVGGRTLATDPITIVVDEVPTVETDPPGSLVFMGFPDKTRAYVNEPVVVTYSLAHDRWTAGLGPRPGARSWPSFDGFRVLERQRWGSFEDLLVDGRTLDQSVIRRVTLLPREPGVLSVDRGMVDARRMDRSRGWDRATGRPRMTSIVLASEPFAVEVLPLPEEGRPASFRGHVGTLAVASRVDRTRVAVGETVTLKVEVSLEGHVETLPDPEIDFPDGFTVSEPEVTTNSRERRGVLSGSRTYIYRLTAVIPGSYRIPAVEMSYFDAGTESYGTARGHPFTITVVPAGREGR